MRLLEAPRLGASFPDARGRFSGRGDSCRGRCFPFAFTFPVCTAFAFAFGVGVGTCCGSGCGFDFGTVAFRGFGAGISLGFGSGRFCGFVELGRTVKSSSPLSPPESVSVSDSSSRVSGISREREGIAGTLGHDLSSKSSVSVCALDT